MPAIIDSSARSKSSVSCIPMPEVNMKLRGLIVLVVAVLLGADEKKDGAAIKAEIEKLKGSWTAESDECDGQKAPDDAVKKTTLTITEDKAVLHEGPTDRPANYVIDPSQTPHTLDLTPAEGQDKGKLVKAIYSL